MKYEVIAKDLTLILLGFSLVAVLFLIFLLLKIYFFIEHELKPLVKKTDQAVTDFNRVTKKVEQSGNQIISAFGRRKGDRYQGQEEGGEGI